MLHIKLRYFGETAGKLTVLAGVLSALAILPCRAEGAGEDPSSSVLTAKPSAPSATEASHIPGMAVWVAVVVLGFGGVAISSVMLLRKRQRKARRSPQSIRQPMAGSVNPSTELATSPSTANGSANGSTPGSKSTANSKSSGHHHHRGTRRRKSVDYTRFFTDLRSKVSDHSSYVEPELVGGFNLAPEFTPFSEPAITRSATVGAPEASTNAAVIAQQRLVIEEQKRLIQEQNKLIEEKKKLLAEKAAQLARQSELVGEPLLPS